MKIESATNVGRIRSTNQDTYDGGIFNDSAAWAVICDGMGGANGGSVASSLALSTIKKHILETYTDDISKGDIKSMIINAINKANQKVFQTAREKPELFGMGTTVVVMIAKSDELYVAHVGDSRAYMKKKDILEQLTVDHSFVQNLIDFGQITEIEAKTHPKRNIITRAVGVHENVRADYSVFDFEKGSSVIACSDGLTNYASNEILNGFMDKYKGKELVNNLIEFAIQSGGSDNITVVLLSNK